MAFRSFLPEPRVRDRTLVIYNRVDSFGLSKAQGLFSEFHAVLGALAFAEARAARDVRVRFDSDYYLDPSRGPNWWSYFFDDRMPVTEGPGRAEEVHCRGAHRYGPHFFNESWTNISNPTNSALMPYPIGAPESLRECRRLVAKFIRVKPDVRAAVDAYFTARTRNSDFVLGVHFRGTDKSIDHPSQKPEFGVYQREIERLLAHYAPSRPRIFFGTDQVEFAEWAARTYGDRAFFLDGAPMHRQTPGAQGVHKDPSIAPYLKGWMAVVMCLLLARCGHLLKNRSALSDCALEFNATQPWTMLLGEEVAHCDVLTARAAAPAAGP